MLRSNRRLWLVMCLAALCSNSIPIASAAEPKPRFDQALTEPICMASIVRVSRRPDRDKNRIAFVNPDNLARDASWQRRD